MIVTLIPKTHKGKNKINEVGDKFEVVRESGTVLFSKELGPWLLLAPVRCNDKQRWVHKLNDENFTVLMENEVK